MMQDIHSLLREITQITMYLETNYPELYQFLDENPMTLPTTDHPYLDKHIMQEYLESLKQLLERHIETRERK